jgi:hypothetical protein
MDEKHHHHDPNQGSLTHDDISSSSDTDTITPPHNQDHTISGSKTSTNEPASFEPIRSHNPNSKSKPPSLNQNQKRRLSTGTIDTLRRERSNNGWGVDDIEADAAGSGIIAPFNLPDPDAAVEHDPFEVGWENGDDDEMCPRSMPLWRKWVIVGITSVGSFCV